MYRVGTVLCRPEPARSTSARAARMEPCQRADSACPLERRVIRPKTREGLKGLSSRSAEAADPQPVLGFLRDHWRRANQAHGCAL